jgi:restriction system protein
MGRLHMWLGWIQYRKVSMAAVDAMTQRQFVDWLRWHFSRSGYKVLVLTRGEEEGLDLLLKDGNYKVGIKAERNNRKVGDRPVILAARERERWGCDRVMIVSSSGYTRAAREVARDLQVVLVGRKTLMDWLR